MSTLLAAIDDSAAARPVLELAIRIGRLAGANVAAVHVRDEAFGDTARLTCEASMVPFHVRHGDVVEAIVSAVHELDAAALVIGMRALPSGTAPAGHVSLRVAQAVSIPVFMVPPDTVDRPLQHLLFAVEGNGEREAVHGTAEQLGVVYGADLIALHVFPPGALPPFSDNPALETEAWAHEFLRRVGDTPYAPVRLELRVGDPALEVSSAVRDLDVDLVVLAWHRDLSPGRARLVRRVLETTSVPVLLLPVENARPPVAAGPRRERSA
jgi:nucleotide-binding universal stress UspA family protein